jgi:hypothetical protein
MKKQRTIGFLESHTCLFCGKEIEGQYEEYEKYYECDCPDAKKKKQIEDLKSKIPREKFVIREEQVLYKK